MFDTIILLTGAVEQAPLTTKLRRHRPDVTVTAVETAEDLARLGQMSLHRARLIGFATPVVVPRQMLNALGYGAYNFHPGPPQYPGWAPAHFALYDQADQFGITLHEMAERVDSGAIIETRSFPIPAGTNVPALESLTYTHLVKLFWDMAPTLATLATPLPRRSVYWGNRRNSRQAYRDICEIPLNITRDELQRRMHAFGGNDFGIAPSIHLHGVEFRAVRPDRAA